MVTLIHSRLLKEHLKLLAVVSSKLRKRMYTRNGKLERYEPVTRLWMLFMKKQKEMRL